MASTAVGSGALCPGDTTQWDDIHRRLGNFAPRKKEITSEELHKLTVEALENYDPLEKRTLEELGQLEDAVEEDTLEKYRKQRMEEMKAAGKASKFGEVAYVDKQKFVREVTEASADGQWVIVLLVVEAQSSSHRIIGPWKEVAKRFPAVKFMQGLASNVMPGFPDASTPLVLIYKDEDCFKQIVGLDEWGGQRCSADCIEWVLSKMKIVKTEIDDDPLETGGQAPSWKRLGRSGGDADDDSEDERDDRCYSSNLLARWPRR